MAVRCNPPVLCLHVAAELIYGLVWAQASDEELLNAHEFFSSHELLIPSLATAEIYARLRSEARRIGRKLPDPDYWIAAHAIENQLPLVSMDNHFTIFDELNLHLLR